MVIGAVAVGAFAFAAVAVGALAVGRLAIGRARIRRLEIDELVIESAMNLVCLWNDTRFVTMLEIPPLNDGLTAVQAAHS
jgi:hypothetical protein